jgi:hypothetical protein
MRDLPLLLIRVLTAGALVAAISVLVDTLKPKMFAGLFAAAPSVATVSLLVTGLATGAAKDSLSARGMIAGAIGLVCYSFVAAVLIKHLQAVAGSVLAWVAWVVPAVPAILPASLTLIEKKEGKDEASIDSVGAILGSMAMIAYAIVISLTVTGWGVMQSIAAALVVWLLTAIGLYFLVALIFKREPHPR